MHWHKEDRDHVKFILKRIFKTVKEQKQFVDAVMQHHASHRGKKLTAQQLEEHVRLCIRYEEWCQCAECVARRVGE